MKPLLGKLTGEFEVPLPGSQSGPNSDGYRLAEAKLAELCLENPGVNCHCRPYQIARGYTPVVMLLEMSAISSEGMVSMMRIIDALALWVDSNERGIAT